MNDLFNAKVLLFGEYAIIKGSMGLALPLPDFNGSLKFIKEQGKIEQKLRLDEFYEYLKGSDLLSKSMDLEQFSLDIKKGCFFDSNIPQGYGVGSSGALCAAIYAKYANDFSRKSFYDETELKSLKDIMALMESFYHGSSSGVDCLISLINLPLVIESRSKINIIETPNLANLGCFYLYDSGNARKTAAFVHQFLAKYEQGGETKLQLDHFIKTTNDIIKALISQDKDHFSELFHDLSRLQYLHFSKMIPDHIKSIWLKGLETNDYYMKLCGAGGGGYFIVYSPNSKFEQSSDFNSNYSKI